MKKRIPFLLLALVPYFLSAQVYVSKVVDQKLLIGPENVSPHFEELSTIYLEDLDKHQQQIQSFLIENQNAIAEINAKKRIKKKDRAILADLVQENEQLELEILVVKDFEKMWADATITQDKINELMEEINNGKCVEIVTDQGRLTPQDFIITATNLEKQAKLLEYIPADYSTPKTEWVKKKSDRPCASGNPEDCLVWCLVETKGGYTFKGYQEKEMHVYKFPLGFDYSEENKMGFRSMTVNLDTGSGKALEVRSNKDQSRLLLEDWFAVECN